MLIPYFGCWPEWINLFLESCKWNPRVRWRLYTDCGKPANRVENVDYVHMSFAEYKALVCKRLRITFEPAEPYKLCDLRPCLAYIHERDVADFRFFGYGDIDVIYGNICSFYTDEVLGLYDVLSTHPERLSGHFAVLRNIPTLRRAFKRVPNYRSLVETPGYMGKDEVPFAAVFNPHGIRRMIKCFSPRPSRSMFVERYSTVLSPRGWHDGIMSYPQKWFWRRGHLTNEDDGERESLYLHFMRWKSTRWMGAAPAPGEGSWLSLKRIIDVEWQRAAVDGFCISPAGFTYT